MFGRNKKIKFKGTTEDGQEFEGEMKVTKDTTPDPAEDRKAEDRMRHAGANDDEVLGGLKNQLHRTLFG